MRLPPSELRRTSGRRRTATKRALRARLRAQAGEQGRAPVFPATC